jgi:competence protein CoiA
MLGRITKEEWKEKMKANLLICPVCQKKVIPKCGNKKVWHFAHSADSNCLAFHEKETEYHLLGKKKLFHWLQMNQRAPILEHYLREIEQRPDIYLPQKNHALEFQCASMHTDLLRSRIEGYQSLHIQSDWIFGKRRLKKLSNEYYSIQSGDLTAAKKDPQGRLYLYYFCPLQQQFLVVKNIVPLTSSKILSKGITYSLKDINDLDQLNKKTADYNYVLNQWINQKYIWRKSAFKNKSPASMYLKKILYFHHKSLTLYSPLAGMPTRDFYHFETAAFIWQSYLLYYVEKLPATFSFTQIETEFLRLIAKGIISIRSFPYLKESYTAALQAYLTYLVKEKYIIQIHENFYKKAAIVPYPATMDEAFKQDKIFSLRGGFFDFV